jgi:hypothetical protein
MIALQRRLDKLTTKYCLFVVPDLNLAPLYAYHLMRTYILKHWEAIQDRHPPVDPLLDEAEQCFLDLLAITPTDPSIISALGHVRLLQRDCEAAASASLWILPQNGRYDVAS